MGCCVSTNAMRLEKIAGEKLRLKSTLSNQTTSIYVCDSGVVWKVCHGEKRVIRKIFMNNYKVKRLDSHANILRPKKLVKLDDNKIAICTKHMTMDLYSLLCTHFDLKRIWKGLRDVVDAMNWLHSKGMAHRDIKPENIVLNAKKFALIDFDFSSPLGERIFCGTPTYAVPKGISNAWTCTNRTRSLRYDIYAFGKTVLFVFCCATRAKMLDNTLYVHELYDADCIPASATNPFYNEEAIWFDIALQCCQREPPSCIPLTTSTYTAEHVGAGIAPLQVVCADDVFA